MPNVGKSTLFNALTKSHQANAQNYPFCTIEPNVGVVEVPDDRLNKISFVSSSKKVVPTAVKFVDIAGLVKGASEGQGLGNKFLSHIREVDAIIHVVRAFADPNVIHVQNKVDPLEDSEIINLELVMADWQTVSARLEKAKKNAKGKTSPEVELELNILARMDDWLKQGRPIRDMSCEEEEKEWIKQLQLLTAKPLMYVINTTDPSENLKIFQDKNISEISVSVKAEAELSELGEGDHREYLKSLGQDKTGLDKIIIEGYKLLNLVTFFTSGEPETRAWTTKNGALAPEAAGVIHTDFIKGFVKADVVNWQDFVDARGWVGSKEKGLVRLEGKEYEIKDGDLCYFHISA